MGLAILPPFQGGDYCCPILYQGVALACYLPRLQRRKECRCHGLASAGQYNLAELKLALMVACPKGRTRKISSMASARVSRLFSPLFVPEGCRSPIVQDQETGVIVWITNAFRIPM